MFVLGSPESFFISKWQVNKLHEPRLCKFKVAHGVLFLPEVSVVYMISNV